MKYRVILEYGLDDEYRETRHYGALHYELEEHEMETVETSLNELIRPRWELRSQVPS